ncbi:MAG: glycosyltransferase family 4 protein [Candidatus Hydrogenedentes bacterium]|nr:glycosyltransferase family 4 protein [Candidatus Hydrogenedentota bacterium]
MISALINGIQLGNKSGTGRYSEELIKGLINLREDILIHLCSSIELGISSPKLKILSLPKEKTIANILLPIYIKSYLNKYKIDIVHHPSFYGPVSSHIPTIVTVHDLAFLENPSWFPIHISTFYKIMIPKSTSQAYFIIADSGFTATQITKHLSIPANRIRVIYLGVSDQFKPASQQEISKIREKYKLPSRYILYLGTLEPRKNIPNMLRGWEKAFPAIRTPIVLIGRKGWKIGEIDKTIKKSLYKEHIHLLGYVPDEDISVIMSGAELFIYLSLYEGFGLPPLEAMKCGTPVMVSNTGSLKEIFANRAILVEPTNIDSISENLVKVIDDDNLKHSLIANGLIYASSFTWEKTARETLQVYKNCLLLRKK